MATTLEINAIRDYLIEVGCKIEYPILVNAFKKHLYNPDPNMQAKVRTQFKDYVNKLATVSLENNMKFILLRPEFRPDNIKIFSDEKQQQQQQQLHKSTDIPLREVSQNKQLNSPKLSDNKQIQQQQQQQVFIPISPPRAINTFNSTPMQTPPLTPQHQKQLSNGVNNKQQYQHSQSFGQPLSQPLSSSVHAHSIDIPTKQQRQQNFNNSNNHLNQKSMHSLSLSDSSSTNSIGYKHDIQDGNILMPPPTAIPPSVTRRNQQQQQQQQQQLQLQNRPESINLSSDHMPQAPPRPPPRRQHSTASLFKQIPKPIEKSKEINELAKKSPGRVKEHASKLNSSASTSDLNALMPVRSNTMKENRLSRDSTIGSLSSALQRNNLQLTSRSRSSHREDESDSSSLQPIDPLRRKWSIEACNCNYNGLLTLLREDQKLAYYKDIVNGYTALHWAAKFGNLDIIKLIAGTHGVSANIKSSAGYTPLHVAAMFNRNEAADLLLKIYKANPDIRDHSGKRAKQYWPKNDIPKTIITTSNSISLMTTTTTRILTPFK